MVSSGSSCAGCWIISSRSAAVGAATDADAAAAAGFADSQNAANDDMGECGERRGSRVGDFGVGGRRREKQKAGFYKKKASPFIFSSAICPPAK